MYTRDPLYHAYFPLPVGRYVQPGAVRVTRFRGMTQTWAISRPTSSFDPNGTPFYMAGTDKPSGQLVVSGFQSLRLPPPKVEADMSDQRTWRRSYRFT